MKKYYYSLFAAASMMLAVTSCSEEESFIPSQNSEFTTFQVSLEGAVQSRTAGDGKTVDKLYYEVYLGEDKILDNYGTDKTSTLDLVSLVDGKATVTMPLLKGERYNIMFWAQKSEGSIYNPDNLKAISLDYTKANSNMEANDAFFWGYADFKATSDATDVVLKRPFAQLNVATTVDDWNLAKTMIPSGLPITSSSVKVNGLANSFNVLNGEATGSQEVTFLRADLLPNEEKLTVNGESKYINLAMNYLLIPGKVEDEGDVVKATTTVDATFWRSEATDAEALFTLNVPNVPIQRNYRTNILGGLLADQKTFNIVVDANFDNEENIYAVNSDEEFEQALRAEGDYIVVDLGSNSRAGGQTYSANIGANTEKYYYGTASTKTITINANGNTINFIHNNTDWNYIRCVNDEAKWIINDAHLTNSGANDGPWNRHDIRFYNAVELNNVTSDKAIALLNNGKLNEVEITEDGDVYALWITADGQTVEINDLDITSAGRGIAIKDQYVDEPAKVTLKVKEAKFDTKKKAAILVTSTAGADITLEKLDLSGVVADQLNAVWVDEDRADYFDLVKVEGGFKVLEGQEDASNPFLIENNTVEVPAGTYAFPEQVAKGVTINCAEGVVFTGTSNLNINGATVVGGTFSNPEGSVVYSNTINGTFKGSTFTGSNALRYCYAGETVVFEDCVFDGDVYGVHFDGGENDATFKNCTLSGFNAFGSKLTQLTFEKCTFKANGKSDYNGANLWGSTTMKECNFIFDGEASYEWIDAIKADGTYEFTDCKINGGTILSDKYFGSRNSANITIDGKLYEKISNYFFAACKEDLKTFADKVNAGEFGAKNVLLTADIDLNNEAWTPIGECKGGKYFHGTFDGQEYTISNLNVDKSEDTYGNSSAGLFGWIDAAGATIKNVKVNNATVKGSHWTGVIAGYATGRIENCTVTNATVVGYNVNDNANGDKIGGIVGYLNEQSYLNGNTVSASTITGNRDLGGIAGGVAASTMEMKNNSVTNVTITYSTPKDYASADVFVSGRTGYVADDSNTSSNVTIKFVANSTESLQAALNNKNLKEINLGAYEFGTVVAKSGEDFAGKTIIGTEGATLGCINLNGADNLTLKNIKFDAAKAAMAYDGKGKERYYGNIISGGSSKNGKGTRGLVIEGCTFEGTFANGGTTIAFNDQSRGSGQSGNITIKNCTFNTQGGYVDIYTYYSGYGELNIEGNTFNSTVTDKPIYLGRYQSNTPVVVKDNKFEKVASFADAAEIQAHSGAYTVSFDAKDNTFAAANE